MIKEETLELLCAAINDCDNAKMAQTSETLRALLTDLEKLKKTGLVRRFDDLGRINIPREVRKGVFGSSENSEEPPHCISYINDLKQSIDDLVAAELKQKIEVIYEVSSDFDEFVQNVISILERVKSNQCIKNYSYFIDNHVHDSYGRESQHVSFTWLDNNDKLHMTGMCLSNL